MLNYLLGLIAILVIWLFVRRYQARKLGETRTADRDDAAAKKKSPYHAVSIRVGPSACLAAKTIEGKRFLAAEAPQLPLTECSSSENCACRFIHHEDRRSGRDRRSPFAPGGFGTGTGRLEHERREGRDRRRRASDETGE